MSIFRRQRDIPRCELAAAAYHLMLCTCRTCGTVHPTPEAAIRCELADWQAVHQTEWELYYERTIPGYANRDCGRCELPLSDAEREHHMEAWRFYPPDQAGPALCHLCIDYLDSEQAETDAVAAEMRAEIDDVIAELEQRDFLAEPRPAKRAGHNAKDGNVPEQFEPLDWDMRDWPPAEQVVDGLVMAVEGCGGNDDVLQVVGEDGAPIQLCGVTRHGGVVLVVVRAVPAPAIQPPVQPPA